MPRPNVLMIVIDSLRADAIFGPRVPTPALDALAERGVSFRQCIATATTTTPSFSSMLTGCFPPKHGVRGLRGYRLSPALKTMAEAFAGAGYETHAEVTGPLLSETGVLRGFQIANHRKAKKSGFLAWREPALQRVRSGKEPWLMLVHTFEVHRPYRTPEGFAKRNDRAAYESSVAATDEGLGPLLQEIGDDTIVILTGDHGEEFPASFAGHLTRGAVRRARRRVALHRWMPRIDDKLAEMDIGHGFALHEHLIRVPLIMAGPGLRPAVIEDQVRHVDLFPTLAELCGLEAPAGLDGRSLTALPDSGTLSEEPAYMEAVGVELQRRRIVGARLPGWKLLSQEEKAPVLLKLDGASPPDEKTNVYARNPDVARRLENFIEQIQATEAPETGMTSEEERLVEQHLRDLGYL